MSIDNIVERVAGDPSYVKFLLVEYPYIRSALDARGVCMDDEYKSTAHSSAIGNSLHCDIIELELWLAELAPQEVKSLFRWANEESYRRPPHSVRRLMREFKERNATTATN